MTTFVDEVEQIEAAEIHLNTGTILAIFLAAALISAVFFGLGYSFGVGGKWKSSAAPVASVAQVPADTGSGMAFSAKPAPGSRFGSAAMASANVKPAVETNEHASARGSAPSLQRVAATVPAHATPHAMPAVRQAEKVKLPARVSAQAASAKASANISANGAFMVQVGAIGNRKDARLLVTALRHDGFHAGIYPGARDKFLHVQIGPFKTREQAQTMRHKVAASGYHALLKHAS